MEDAVPTLADRLRALWRHALLIVLMTVLGLAGALAYVLDQPDVYAATSRVVVLPTITAMGTSPGLEAPLGSEVSIDTEAQIAVSPFIAALVLETYGDRLEPLAPTPVTPATLSGSMLAEAVTEDVIEIQGTALSPELAALLANAFADRFLASRLESANETITTVTQTLQARIERLGSSIQDLDAKIVKWSSDADDRGRPPDNGATAPVDLERLRAERDQLIVERSTLRSTYESLVADPTASGGGRILQRAEPPAVPSSTDPLRAGAVGAFLGFIVGVALAFAKDTLDDRVRTRSDAARAAQAPVLATAAGRIRRRRKASWDRLASIGRPDSAEANAYRTLRANLVGLGLGERIGRLLIAPVDHRRRVEDEALNLSITLARTGIDVIAILAALRRHSDGVGADGTGLREILADGGSVDDAIIATEVPGLRILPAGRGEDRAPDLLGSTKLADIFDQADRIADVVVVSGSPVNAQGDALTLASRVGAAVLIVWADRDRRAAVALAASALRQAGCDVLGVVLMNAHRWDRTIGTVSPSVGSTASVRIDESMNGHGRPASLSVEPAARAGGGDPTERRSGSTEDGEPGYEA